MTIEQIEKRVSADVSQALIHTGNIRACYDKLAHVGGSPSLNAALKHKIAREHHALAELGFNYQEIMRYYIYLYF